jgi:hypothetical protein
MRIAGRFREFPGKGISLLLTILLLSFWPREEARAQSGVESAPPTTLVIFAEHKMEASEWSALFDALEKSARATAVTTPALGGEFSLVRGDTMPRGLAFERSISVYLQRDCRLAPRPVWGERGGVLGWVYSIPGGIAPFIHVDCGKIAEQLEPIAPGMSRGRLDILMGEAVARVIVHEWVHVATQSAGHRGNGVAKSTFGVADLLAADDAIWADPRFAHRKRPEL